MLTDLRPITQDEMLLDWGLAEVAKPEMGFDAAVVSRVRAKAETREDQNELVRRIKLHRAPLLNFFSTHPVQWFAGNLSTAVIGQISVIRYFQLRYGPHIKTMADVAQYLPDKYSIQNFHHDEMRGRPIFVAQRRHDPLHLLEGTHRCCEILLRPSGASSLRVVFGECPLISEWDFWP